MANKLANTWVTGYGFIDKIKFVEKIYQILKIKL